jgi:hypothetical protein
VPDNSPGDIRRRGIAYVVPYAQVRSASACKSEVAWGSFTSLSGRDLECRDLLGLRNWRVRVMVRGTRQDFRVVLKPGFRTMYVPHMSGAVFDTPEGSVTKLTARLKWTELSWVLAIALLMAVSGRSGSWVSWGVVPLLVVLAWHTAAMTIIFWPACRAVDCALRRSASQPDDQEPRGQVLP